MRMTLHRGGCCGIRHIYLGPGQTPSSTCLEKAAGFSAQLGEATNGECYTGKAFPQETHLERFDRYLELDAKDRPKGIVEVVLIDYRVYGAPSNKIRKKYNQLPQWEDVLLERGFKRVSECINSNSTNGMYVYHLCRGNKESE